MILFVAIDDCPSRYDEFVRKLDRYQHDFLLCYEGRRLMPMLAEWWRLNEQIIILLDHDMPGLDGRQWASVLTEVAPYPVIITSTTGVPGAIATMEQTLKEANVPVYVCGADHFDCESEWIAWANQQYEPEYVND